MKTFYLLILTTLFTSAISAQTITDIKKVDFENFTHRIKTDSVKIKDGLQIGSCKKDADGVESGDIWNVSKETIGYGDLDGDGKAEAIVPMVANVCGANMITNETVLVYTLKAGKPTALPEFEYYDKGCEEGAEGCNYDRVMGVTVEYDAAAKAIAVANYFATDDDAICCPSFLRKTWFRWDKTKFVELKKGEIEANKMEEM
jgi:hypothetical protein